MIRPARRRTRRLIKAQIAVLNKPESIRFSGRATRVRGRAMSLPANRSSLPAGHFGLGHGSGAHAPDEYYVIESSNPKIQGIDGATMSFVQYLYEFRKVGNCIPPASRSQRLVRPDHRYIHFHVSRLAVDRFIEAEFFVRILDAHGSDAIDDPQHAECENERPDRREQSRAELLQEEARVAGEQSIHAAVGRRIPRRRSEHAEQNNAEEAADAVHAPHIERVVPAQFVLQRAGVIADDARNEIR